MGKLKEVLCDRKMHMKLKGKIIQNTGKVSIAVWGRDMVNNEKPSKEIGGE